MLIGAVSQATGASSKAIRLYEQLGLLGVIHRVGAYRHYTEAQLERVLWIRKAQQLGFRLQEIPALLGPTDAPPDWPKLLARLQEKAAQLAAEIAALQATHVEVTAAHREVLSCLATQPGASLGSPGSC